MIRLALCLFASIAIAAPAMAQSGNTLRPQIMAGLPELPDQRVEDPRRPIGPGLFLHNSLLREAMSEEGQWFAGHDRDGALTIRQAGGDAVAIAQAEGNFRWHAEGARLSEDGLWIAAKMVDETSVYSAALSDGQGGTRSVRYTYAGEALPTKRLFLVSRDGQTRVEIPLSMDYLYIAGFDSDGRGLRYIESDRTGRNFVLRHFDAVSGHTSTLLEERSDKWSIAGYDLGDFYSARFERSNRMSLLDDERFLWLSDHSGFRRLYAHYDGVAPRAIALPSDEILLDVVGIDQTSRIAVLHTALNGEPWAHHRLHAVDLETLETRAIFDAPFIAFSEMIEGGVAPVVAELPSTVIIHKIGFDGVELAEPDRGDLSFLDDEPVKIERLTLPGADGTPLQALLIVPESGEDLPLVDWIYGGPQTAIVPRDPVGPEFSEALLLARRGIATIFIDARGTPGRGAAFAHAQDGQFGATVIPDHRTAIQSLLARDDARIDPDKVGVMGHSWGGYFTLRAMIEAPELFKAGIMLAPNTNVSEMRVPVEAYQGCLPAACPAAYAQGDLTDRLDELRGPLLVIHGQADDDVLPEVTDKLEIALKAVNADYEVVRLKNAHHIVQREPDFIDRIASFWMDRFGD